MLKKVAVIIVILSFLVMNAAITYAPAYAKVTIEKSFSDVNSEKSENDSEKEELRLVELEEFLVSPLLLLHASYRCGRNLYPINTRLELNPYFSLPYPPPNA